MQVCRIRYGAALLFSFSCFSAGSGLTEGRVDSGELSQDTESYSVPFERIDCHVHVMPPPAEFLEMLECLNVRLVNVTLVDPFVPGFDRTEPQTSWAAETSQSSRGRIEWAATFDPAGLDGTGYTEQTKRHLLNTFDRGAVAVKMYKSVGMVLQGNTGEYIMPDDPGFSPTLEFIAGHNRTLLAHLADPKSFWSPIDPADPHSAYRRENPNWDMFLHPKRPSWENIIDARDRLLKEHTGLRVIGCHLGSMEQDLEELAIRLETYSNLAVDTAARMGDLMTQPREKVRAFLMRFQDRVLWGTDLMELQWENPERTIEMWKTRYDYDWRYLATLESFKVGEQNIQGLGLPEGVLRKIFRENPLRWIPLLSHAEAWMNNKTSSAECPDQHQRGRRRLRNQVLRVVPL